MRRNHGKIWIIAVIFIVATVALSYYNRPIELINATLMSTPLIFSDSGISPYTKLPRDITPPTIDIFYATDRQPTTSSFLHPLFYDNNRSMSIYLGMVSVHFGADDMSWKVIERASLMQKRSITVPLQIIQVEQLHEIGSAAKLLEESLKTSKTQKDPFIKRVESRLANSKEKVIYLFVPGFKVNFAYPVLVATELWHYLGYSGAFIAYSWPSRQKLTDYLTDVETAAFSAQHLRMLLRYLADKTSVEKIHLLSYSAGARIVSQALHELKLTGDSNTAAKLKQRFKIGKVIFTAPDIDKLLFAARYRDGFDAIADNITIYTNANDTALMWALRFLGWPRLGAPGDMGLKPEDLHLLEGSKNTVIVDVSAAENAAAGNGHGYFVKSPWVSSDIILTLKHQTTPAQRGLYWSAEEAAWNFPENYPQLLPAIVHKLH